LQNSKKESVPDAAAHPDVRHIIKDRARQKLPPRIKDPATLNRIAQLIEGAAPAQRKPRLSKKVA
jgi:hypothetical protein